MAIHFFVLRSFLLNALVTNEKKIKNSITMCSAAAYHLKFHRWVEFDFAVWSTEIFFKKSFPYEILIPKATNRVRDTIGVIIYN